MWERGVTHLTETDIVYQNWEIIHANSNYIVILREKSQTCCCRWWRHNSHHCLCFDPPKIENGQLELSKTPISSALQSINDINLYKRELKNHVSQGFIKNNINIGFHSLMKNYDVTLERRWHLQRQRRCHLQRLYKLLYTTMINKIINSTIVNENCVTQH